MLRPLIVLVIPLLPWDSEWVTGMGRADSQESVIEVVVPNRSFAVQDSVRQRIIEMLGKSPLLDPTQSVVREAQYVRDAKALLDSLGFRDGDIINVEDATRELEKQLAGGALVVAIVESETKGLTVRYRRMVDPSASELTVSTTVTLSLVPALYVFWCIHPETGEKQERRADCTSTCTVTFPF